MERKDYEEFVNNKFERKTKKLILDQIDNFYNLETKKLKNNKYKIGDDVILDKYTLMTGFGNNKDYLELIAKEGKICGDFANIKSGHGVKWAVSTWKFKKKITLHDYVINYSGMTVVWNNNYEIIPYGKLDEFVEKMKNKNHFCWDAESTREIRFLPSFVRDNNQIAIIFNIKKGCKKLLHNDLLNDHIPEELFPKIQLKRKEEQVMQDGFADRVAYILFGIPRNCIEGIFVNRDTEQDKTYLEFIKELFPDCYICNVDGKVIVE